MKPMHKVTGADVAKRAGVSRATVSYVLNNTPGQTIPDDTRQRVKDAATALGYVPQMAGRTLRRGRSDLVACVLPDWPIGPAMGSLIEQLSAEAASRRYTLALLRHSAADQPLESAIRTLSPAALVVMEELPASTSRMAKLMNVPVVSTLDPDDAVSGVVESQLDIGATQVRHLVAAGHRRIAYLYPTDERVRMFADTRFRGAEREAKAQGIEPLDRVDAPLDRLHLKHTAERWKAAGITAVVSYNDEWAMGLMSGMQLLDLRAPDDLAIIGVDDVPTAAVASPPLTTIRQIVAPMATSIFDRVALQLGERPRKPIVDAHSIELIVRDSA